MKAVRLPATSSIATLYTTSGYGSNSYEGGAAERTVRTPTCKHAST